MAAAARTRRPSPSVSIAIAYRFSRSVRFPHPPVQESKSQINTSSRDLRSIIKDREIRPTPRRRVDETAAVPRSCTGKVLRSTCAGGGSLLAYWLHVLFEAEE